MEQYESPFGVIHKSRESRKAKEVRRRKLQQHKADVAARSNTVHARIDADSAFSDRERINANARGYMAQQAKLAQEAAPEIKGGGKGKYVAGGVTAAGLGAAGAAKLIASRMGQTSNKGMSTARKLGIGAAGTAGAAGVAGGGYAYSRRNKS
jgi:hypothetical protein